VKIKKSNRFGKLSSRELQKFELKYALCLPEDYRKFLLKHNGGDPSPTDTIDFQENGKTTSSNVQFIYGIHDGEYWASLKWYLENLIRRVVEEGLPIAGDSSGNQYILILRGNSEGQIYFWDHELETETPSYQNMSFVAASFSEFLEKLYEYVEPDEAETDRIIRQNDLAGLQKLLESGYDVNKELEYGRTLIEYAAIKNCPEIIQMLFEYGAELRNALEYAKKNYEFFEEHKVSVDLLESMHEPPLFLWTEN